MKKMTKIVLVTVLVLGVAGVLLAGAGIVSGASFETFAESTNESAFSRRVLRNIGNIVHWDDRWEHWEDQIENDLEQWGDDFEEDMETWGENLEDRLERSEESLHHRNHHQQRSSQESGSQSNPTSSQTFPVNQVENLSVETNSDEVEIKTGTGSEIEISNLCQADMVEYDAEDRELYIVKDCSRDNQEPLTITIPQDKRFQELDLEVLSGNLAVVGKLLASEASLTIESGNLSVELLDSRETDIECYSGNLSVKHTGKITDYRIEMQTNSGNVKLDDQSYTGQVQGVFGNRSSQKSIDVEGNSGNMKIAFENK